MKTTELLNLFKKAKAKNNYYEAKRLGIILINRGIPCNCGDIKKGETNDK